MKRIGTILKVLGIFALVGGALFTLISLIIVIIGVKTEFTNGAAFIISLFSGIGSVALGGFIVWVAEALINDGKRLDSLQRIVKDLSSKQ